MTSEILVVDDNLDIRILISSILKDKGFNVREAANFDQALIEIKKKAPPIHCELNLQINNDSFINGFSIFSDNLIRNNTGINII